MIGKNSYRKKEILLLANLRKNGRATLTELSQQTDVPISTVHDKLKNQTLIKKYTCILDFPKLGFTTTANIFLRVKKEDKDMLREHLLRHFNVNSLYKINSGYDFLVEGIFRNIKELEEFTEELDEKFSIRQKQVYYIIDEIAKECFMGNPQTAMMVLDA
ncbi:MAG: Lrp/AsnC family transcriptional regulator [Nanoarchaeota archaeon]